MWDADSTHSSHPFDVEDRWLTVRDTQTFKHPTTNWNIILATSHGRIQRRVDRLEYLVLFDAQSKI